jgi:hypothetical protein
MPRWKQRKGRGAVARREAAREAEAAVGIVAAHDPADRWPWPQWGHDLRVALVEAGVDVETAGAVAGEALLRAREAEAGRALDHAQAVTDLAAGQPVRYHPGPMPPLTPRSRTRLTRVAPAVLRFLPEAAQQALAAAGRVARHELPGYARFPGAGWIWAAQTVAAAAVVLAVHLLHP